MTHSIAVHSFPGGSSSEAIVDIPLPITSNTFNETNDRWGRLNEIVVAGLNGFG